MDYALIDQQILPEIGIKIQESKGNSPDEYANALWHRNLVELSAPKLLQLARSIFAKAEKKRVVHKTIMKNIGQGVAKGELDRNKLKLGLINKLKT